MTEFKALVKDCLHNVEGLLVSPSNLKGVDKENFLNYKESRVAYLKKSLLKNIQLLPKVFDEYAKQIDDPGERKALQEIVMTLHKEDFNLELMKERLKMIEFKIGTYASPKKKSQRKNISLPVEIREEVQADLNEIEKCFAAGCYRSVVILSGRVLETALHRKYYEATENDLLEKAPGIGLGKIIAKLEEKGVSLGPGLTQQIHLINQVRIFSVHTKAEPFYPSKNQAEAITLFMMDILEKMWK